MYRGASGVRKAAQSRPLSLSSTPFLRLEKSMKDCGAPRKDVMPYRGTRYLHGFLDQLFAFYTSCKMLRANHR